MPLNKYMNKDNVVGIENGVLFCDKDVQIGAAEVAQSGLCKPGTHNLHKS